MFPLPEFPLRKINSIEWKYHTINKTILLARINLNKQQHSKIFSKRTGMQITENGSLQIEDIKDEDSGNYSCTIIFHDQKMQIEQIFLQVHNGTFVFYLTDNSRSFLQIIRQQDDRVNISGRSQSITVMYSVRDVYFIFLFF